MDPTMQSPIRMSVPISPSDTVDIPIPSGPHFYSNKTWIGRVSDGIAPRRAYEALARHATPGQSGTSVDGGIVDIPMIGPVRQFVDPDRMRIVNTTEPGHWLYPGNVHRWITQEGDDLYVTTHGYGTGILPLANRVAAPRLWSSVDHDIRRELNPEIKPLEAAAGLVRDSINHSETPTRNNVFEYGFPSPDAMSLFTTTRASENTDPPPDEAARQLASPRQAARPIRYLDTTRVRY